MGSDNAIAEYVRRVAKASFSAAIEWCALIEILEAGNTDEVTRGIEDTKAVLAASVLWKALFGRLLIGVMMSFPDVRPGDLHLRGALDLLRDKRTMDVLLRSGAMEARLQAALAMWEECLTYPTLDRLRVLRNKEAAHDAELPDGFDRPAIESLFGLTRLVAGVAEHLANGVGIVALTLESQVTPYAQSAEAFWAHFGSRR